MKKEQIILGTGEITDFTDFKLFMKIANKYANGLLLSPNIMTPLGLNTIMELKKTLSLDIDFIADLRWIEECEEELDALCNMLIKSGVDGITILDNLSMKTIEEYNKKLPMVKKYLYFLKSFEKYSLEEYEESLDKINNTNIKTVVISGTNSANMPHFKEMVKSKQIAVYHLLQSNVTVTDESALLHILDIGGINIEKLEVELKKIITII